MKKGFYSILILTTLSSAWAVTFQPTRQILITGKDCSEVLPHAQSIMEWSLKISPTFELKMPRCYCSDDDCNVDVLKVSPPFVKEYTKFSGGYSNASAYNGPNCFNAALLATRTLVTPSFTHPQELTYLLSSPLWD